MPRTLHGNGTGVNWDTCQTIAHEYHTHTMKAIKANPIYPLAAVRTLALHAQGLAQPPAAQTPPTPDTIYDLIEQMGCVQIDTLQMVQRSQYIAVWSRLGTYSPVDLDQVAYGSRRLFEYWLHAACLIPLKDYRYRLPVMRWHRADGGHWYHGWSANPDNLALMKAVLKRIQHEGPLRAADFEHPETRRGTWWDWKPAKHALEHLFNQGRLLIANRVNFQRVYDLRERILPDWVDTTEPTDEEMQRHWVERSLKALGVCDAGQVAGYVHDVKRLTARAVVKQLIDEGAAVEIQAELSDGLSHSLVVHCDHLPALEQAADGALRARHTTFLSPFDNLWWAPGRDMQVWGFRQALEAYKPKGTQQYGYFCLPILHHDRLVGRFDPKLERQAGRLRLKALYLEPKVKPDEELVSDVAAAMRDFLKFHNATDLVIERSEPAAFGKKLLKAM